MNIFLEILAKHLLDKHGKSLSEFALIFPNRRSGLFFQRFLALHTKDTMWLPQIRTINELMQDLSSLQLADPIDIQFELYDIYKSLVPTPDSFDEFFPWGEMMVSDFDHLDKYLVNPEEIFKNIKELKEIDEKFGGLEEEQVEYIRKFWKNFHDGDMSKEKEVFLQTWEILPKLYHKLTNLLKSQMTGYEGMIYREVAELDIVELDKKLEAKNYIFIGFNALSLCELMLFKRLKGKGVTSFYWDYDKKYIADSNMEAGRFMRENLIAFPPADDLNIFDELNGKKEIRIFDLPTDILQAKTVHKILSEREELIEDVNDTAIVACDENLLMPVLVSLPEKIDDVNITMGYPFRNTPMFGLLEAILKLVRNIRRSKSGKGQFYYKDVLSVLNHQYYRLISDETTTRIQEKIAIENRVYIAPSFFTQDFDNLIFGDIQTVTQLIESFDRIFRYILKKLQSLEDQQYTELEKEYVLLLLTRLNKLSDLLKDRSEIELLTFIRLFRKILINQRVPFIGEPLAGLQVMGILETRLLDFKNVILLSMNEEIMPRSNQGNSFIPYSLRFAYHLPTREEMDAIYAFYFFRLIQRAERVDLLFNSSAEGVKSGEMSRYLYQMKYDMGAEIIRPVLSVLASEKRLPEIKKTPEVMELLKRYHSGNKTLSYLSPSALNTYLECSLKFYYQNLLRIRKGEEVSEEVDAIGLGIIVHDTIAELYEKLKKESPLLQREKLEGLLKDKGTDKVLMEVFRDVYFQSDRNREIEGKNLITFDIIRKYLHQIIKTDINIAPFELIDLEEKYLSDLKIETLDGELSIAIGGKIDRIDKTNDSVLRIIDYKTGNAKLTFPSIESLFDTEHKTRNKEAFQALLYSWIYLADNPVETVLPGLYVMRSIFKKDYSPGFRMGERKDIRELENFVAHKEQFESYLLLLMEEIYNSEIPFRQTSITDRCKYCDFSVICQRT